MLSQKARAKAKVVQEQRVAPKAPVRAPNPRHHAHTARNQGTGARIASNTLPPEKPTRERQTKREVPHKDKVPRAKAKANLRSNASIAARRATFELTAGNQSAN